MDQTFFDIPNGIEIPDGRRKANRSNALWILRNVLIKNAGKPGIDNVLMQAKAVAKGERLR